MATSLDPVGGSDSTVFLIWEDEDPGGGPWWLARAKEGRRDFFIAVDDLTFHLVVMVRETGAAGYQVIAALSRKAFADDGAALAAAKQAAVAWLRRPGEAPGRDILVWRLRRWLKLTLQHVPLGGTAFVAGGLLGLAVGLFSVSVQLVGWPMLAAGLAIGAGAGPALKYLVDRRFKSPAGTWGRFAIVTLSALAGAAVTAGGVLFLFWT